VAEEFSWVPEGVDTGKANVARVYDYWLGGTHNLRADQDAARALLAIDPTVRDLARANRAFLGRAVRFLAASGIRQFLDIGSGIPTERNVHEVAQEAAPGARVAYVDYDPVVLSHARALLAKGQDVVAVEGDLRSPEAIMADERVRQLIDFSQPVAVLVVAVLHFVSDADRPYDAVRTLVDAIPPGSYLVLTHSTPDDVADDVTEAMKDVYSNASAQVAPRKFEDVARFFDGLELIEPGLVNVTLWRPAPGSSQPSRPAGRSLIYGGVARKR
jgi:hypothetical protein